jgi:H/ACA ribonucleoprotein complex subunit 3
MNLMRCCVYTLQENCPKCGSKTLSAHPPRFSFADKYAKYRRIAKHKL